MSAEQALTNYYKKQHELLQKEQRPKKKYKQQEKIVVKDCMKWFKANNFDMHVIEAKDTYNARAGTYVKGPVEPGYSDISGNDSNGLACWVEVKAKDKRYSLSEKQRHFLIRKIKSHCFAVVVDSTIKLEMYYKNWLLLKKQGKHKEACLYLINSLPKKRKVDDDGPLF